MKIFSITSKKKLVRHLFSFVICSFIVTSSAQNDPTSTFTLPEIIKPSPTVSQLMKFEEVSLSHYTGQPNINIPLFAKSINGLNYRVALQYQVSGIRVNEQSGWVGKGWALDTGGVISRTVVGLPDEINVDHLYKGVNYNLFHEYFNWDRSNLSTLNPNPSGELILDTESRNIMEFDYNARYGRQQEKQDYQRDIYQFNFFGNTGRFIFVKENNVLVPKIIGNDNRLKIEPVYISQGPSGGLSNPYPEVIEKFIITDTDGFKYTFDVIEETKSSTTTLVSPRGGGVTIPSTDDLMPEYRSAWKLSNVETPTGLNLVTFLYQDVLEKPESPTRTVSNYQERDANLISLFGSCLNNGKPNYVHSKNSLEIDSKKVREVIFRDSTKLVFSSTQEHPEYDGARLNKIEIYEPIGVLNKSLDFVYDSHMSDPSSQDPAHNHKLLFLNEIEINNDHKYSFSYKNKENLRAFGDNTVGRDYFGYFSDHSGLLSPHANKVNVISGALHTITYPTGGVRKYFWESNTYSYKGSSLLTFDEMFQNPDNYIEDTLTYSFTDNSNTGGFEPVDEYFYIDPDQTVNTNHSILASTDPNTPHLYSYGFEFTPVLGSESQPSSVVDTSREVIEISYSGDSNSYVDQAFFKTGLYKITYVYNINFQNNSSYTVNIELGRKSLITGPLNWFLYGGGLRVRSVEDSDNGAAQIKTNFNYAKENILSLGNGTGLTLLANDPNGDNYSSGSYDGESAIHREYDIWINEHYRAGILGSFGTDPLIDPMYSPPAKYRIKEHQSSIMAQLTQGNFIGYQDVTQYKTTSFSNMEDYSPVRDEAQTKYTFHSSIDFPSYPVGYSYPYPTVKDNSYKKGNLKRTLIFNTDNELLKQIENTFNYEDDNIENIVAQSINYVTNENDLAYHYTGSNDYINIHDANANYISVRKPLSQILRNFYSDFDDFFANSINTVDVTDIEVSCNIPGGPNQSGVRQQVMDNGPFYNHSITKKLTVDLTHLIDEYNYKVQLESSVSSDYFPDSSGYMQQRDELTYNDHNYQLKQRLSFFNEGGVEKELKTKYYYPVGVTIPTNTTLVIKQKLETLNKINEIIAIETFEDGLKLSQVNTTYEELEPNSDLIFPTEIEYGKGSNIPEPRLEYVKYDDYSNVLEVKKENGISICYVWGYNNTFPVAKLVGVSYANIESNPNIDITTGLGGLSITQINLLRQEYPNAQILTYEYDPMAGITSMTDPKGYTMTYEYDEFNRLKHVKDQNGNILSKNEYNYKNQY